MSHLSGTVYCSAKLLKPKPPQKLRVAKQDASANSRWTTKSAFTSSAHKVWFQLHLWIAHSLRTSGASCFLKGSHIFHKVMRIQQLLYTQPHKTKKWHSASPPSWNISSRLCIYCTNRVWLFKFFFFFGWLHFITCKLKLANYRCCVAKFWLYT